MDRRELGCFFGRESNIVGGDTFVDFFENCLIFVQWREPIIDQFGADTYHNTYNALSTLACSGIAFSYIRYRRSGSSFHYNFFNVSEFVTTSGMRSVYPSPS